MPDIHLVFKGQTWFGLSVSLVAAVTAWMVGARWGRCSVWRVRRRNLGLESRSRRVHGKLARCYTT